MGRIVAPGFQLAGPKPKRLRLVSLPRAIAPPRGTVGSRRDGFQRLLYRRGRLTRSRIASPVHSTGEKLPPHCLAAELQLVRCRPALYLRMAEFDPGTI